MSYIILYQTENNNSCLTAPAYCNSDVTGIVNSSLLAHDIKFLIHYQSLGEHKMDS